MEAKARLLKRKAAREVKEKEAVAPDDRKPTVKPETNTKQVSWDVILSMPCPVKPDRVVLAAERESQAADPPDFIRIIISNNRRSHLAFLR